MGFIERELNQVINAMSLPLGDKQYCHLYAVQQALSWALDPTAFASPLATVLNSKIQPLRGTQEGLGGCSVHPHQPQS
jgi:hypothetical protein